LLQFLKQADKANKKANNFIRALLAFRQRPVDPPFLAQRSEAKIVSEQSELQCRRVHGSPDELVMFRSQPLKCAPAHPLRLAAIAVEDAGFPPQASAAIIKPVILGSQYAINAVDGATIE